MNEKLGSLTSVDVRTVWPNEAADFTPWLAANISLLGEALRIELEVESTEVAVGPYSADILARDSGSGEPIVIENQLGKTDHDHLGKSITYAAVLGATSIVWIASNFTEEHRKALDWLNDHSSSDVSFFGVRLELWQVDESRPAVRFNVLSQPAEILRTAALQRSSDELSDVKKLQLEWWTQFREALAAAKIVPSVQAPGPRYWYNVALGRAGVHLSNVANTYDNRIGVRVYLRGRYNGESALAQLLESKVEIEKEIGEPLVWNPNPENRDKVIALYLDADLNRRDKWPEYIEWMLDRTTKLRQAFAPRARLLDLDTAAEPDEDGGA